MKVFMHPCDLVERIRRLRASSIVYAVGGACLALTTSQASAAFLDRQVKFHIPAQPLESALMEFSREADVQMAVDAASLQNIQVAELTGTLWASAALTKLLSQTGLSYRVVGGTVTVTSNSKVSHTEAAASSGPEASGDTQTDQTGHQDFWSKFKLAEASQSGTTQSKDGTDLNAKGSLEEVIVTAQKREERLLDVPVPVTALSADVLVENNQLRLRDYYSQIPGLGVTSQGIRDAPVLSIRGITTGATSNPTVGIVVDDIPYGSSTNLGGGSLAPDIDPSDLSRIEVLRGPQGTLYGADSMGGLIKYVTVDPSADKFSGRVEAGTDSVYNGSKPSYQLRAAVNAPITGNLAIRLSGFTRQDAGYIDNRSSTLAVKGINEGSASGGRASVLWSPSDSVSLKLSALLQEARTDGSPSVEPALGGLSQGDARGTGQSDKRQQVFTAVLKAKLANVDLVSITGYNINRYSGDIDYSPIFGPFSQVFGYGVDGFSITEDNKSKRLTQEIRATIPMGDRIQWLLGGFYSHESTSYSQKNLAIDPTTGVVAGAYGTNSFPSGFKEYAGFTDVTFQLTDAFDIQIGGRESRFRQNYHQSLVGDNLTLLYLGRLSPVIQPEEENSASAFTYLFTPRYRISPDWMVYARFASGFRAGAINLANDVLGLPLISKPDKTESYEVGAKGSLLDNRLSFDVSLYDIEWDDIQITTQDPLTSLPIYTNGGHARSKGIELSGQVNPIDGLKASAWLTFSEAALTENFPANTTFLGKSGDLLPYSTKFSGNVSLEQEFSVWDEAVGYTGMDASYVGSRESDFTAGTTERQSLAGYAVVNLRVGMRKDAWRCTLFLNNALDRRGTLGAGALAASNRTFTYIQPKTIGVTVSAAF